MRVLSRCAFILVLFLSVLSSAWADDGSRLWLRYGCDKDAGKRNPNISTMHASPTIDIVRRELLDAWSGMDVMLTIEQDATKTTSPDSYSISIRQDTIIISSPSDIGLLYGTYALLRMQACGELDKNTINPATTSSRADASTTVICNESPTFERRILNHWDNLNGTVERGYAGASLWQWDELPALSPRYEAYARANASIGINGTVLNNVNASPQILSSAYLNKVKALADVFRPYGLKVYLSVNFASPMALGGLPTADPNDGRVAKWWHDKVKEIYSLIPDFGGFLVKANSEGQPGPCDFGRTHTDGANMLADALKPYRGIVMWRAFVYSPSDDDRAKQAYTEFVPLDGSFRDNVIIQAKNGPIDFQPREPYHPLFSAMQNTPMMGELQITQEYLGHSHHLAFLATMWQEFFSLVAHDSMTAIAGVANIGSDTNWCGSHFAQSNWYAYGRMAWNPSLEPHKIAEEWLRQTFDMTDVESNDSALPRLADMMTESHEAVVDYMMPLGLHHIFAWGHHYGPEPWCDIKGARADWLPVYYHRADSLGLGFDRTHRGSNAVAQYPEPLRSMYDDINSCPEKYLLWFHHAPWTHIMNSGRTMWDELCHRYDHGVRKTREFCAVWDDMQQYIDTERFVAIRQNLLTQTKDAAWWRDACLLYFQQFSRMAIPSDIEQPQPRLDKLKKIKLGISNYEAPSAILLDSVR